MIERFGRAAVAHPLGGRAGPAVALGGSVALVVDAGGELAVVGGIEELGEGQGGEVGVAEVAGAGRRSRA
jgi:hypothetical protein